MPRLVQPFTVGLLAVAAGLTLLPVQGWARVGQAADMGSAGERIPALREATRWGTWGTDPAPRLAGEVESEGVEAIGAYAWHQAGISGAGVKVGLIDSGFGGFRELLGTELPEAVTTSSFRNEMTEVDETDIVHGTACAEVIHDVAPGAELFLAAANSQTETMEAIEWLESQGVQVISMSKTWFAGSMDGTSELDRFIEQSAARGIAWVIASGNFAESHYLGEFYDPDGDGYHEFAEGHELLQIYPEEEVTLALNWDDWQVGDQDYDLFLLDGDGNVIASSENQQNGPEAGAYELIYYKGLDPGGTYYAAFYAARVTRPGQLNFFVLHGKVEGAMPEISISMPAESGMVLGVGATYWETDELEPYSGQGPTLDGRLKPDLTAPSVVSIAASENAFNGTSAAAPHAAGAAALLLEAYPDFTPQQTFDFLKSRALDLGEDGPDTQFGYGRLWLGDPAERYEPPKAEPTVSAVVTLRPSGVAPVTAQPREVRKGSKTRALHWLGLACLTIPGLLGLAGLFALGAALIFTRTKANVRRCRFCGQALGQVSRFCPRCGRPVG